MPSPHLVISLNVARFNYLIFLTFVPLLCICSCSDSEHSTLADGVANEAPPLLAELRMH